MTKGQAPSPRRGTPIAACLAAALVLLALLPTGCRKNRAPGAPTVTGPLGGAYGDTLEFSVSATDPDRDDVSYFVEWGDSLTDGWSAASGSGQAVSFSHVYADSGSYQLRVRARDPEGMESDWSNPRSVAIGAASPDKPATPTGPDTCEEAAAAEFAAVGISPTGESVFVRFDFGDSVCDWQGPLPSGDTFRVTHAYDTMGSYAVRAQARHTSGAESQWSDARPVTVIMGRPAVPGAPFGPDSTHALVTAEFRVSTTAPGQRQVRYVVEWGDGEVETTATSSPSPETVLVSHTWTSAGAYAVRVRAYFVIAPNRVSDWSAPTAVQVRANQAPLVPQFALPGFAVPGVSAGFTAQTTDADGDSVRFQFDYGDGLGDWTALVPSGATATDSHSYLTPETVFVKCRARDQWGAQTGWSDSAQFVVEQAGLVRWYWWKDDQSRQPAITTPLVLSDGGSELVYAGGADGGFYAIDDSGETRHVGNALRPGGAFNAHPAFCYESGNIIAGNADGVLYAFSPGLSRSWTLPADVGGAAWGTPAVNGSRVYVPRADDSLYVLLDFGLNFGVEAVAAVPGGVSDAPVVNAAGNVCFGTGDGWLFLMSATLDSTLWSIQLEAGSRVSAPAIGPDGTIYAGTGAGRVFAIRAADGDTLWTAVLHGSSARPVVGAGAVFVPTAGGWLHALDPGSGAELWQWQSDLGRALVAAPILTSGGYIYCQDTTDVVYCLRQSDRTRVWSCDCRSFLPQGGNHGSEWTRPSPAITSAGDVIVPGYDALFSLPGLRGEVLGASAWPKWQHDPYNSGKAGSRVR